MQERSGPWRIVKRVHSGLSGDFTAVVAVGRTGGWAFNGIFRPTAWRRRKPPSIRTTASR